MESDKKKYKLIKRIGEGASGKAYLVLNTEDNINYVIKTVFIDNMDDNKQKEAVIEASILQKLDHPNIIQFKDTFTMKKPRYSLCIVMEYAEGGDLKSKISSQKGNFFEENQIFDWFTQICLAIKHIHDRKILHRDLKTQNIFLTINGLVKLGDFGIAKCLNHTFDKASTYIGTPYYLSPEIIQNISYSFKSDIWSLGIILYELCCLRMPFETTNIATLSLLIIQGIYEPIPNHYSEEMKQIIKDLLLVDQSKRPNINKILEYPKIKSRIKNYLNEIQYNNEFSHTVIHNIVIIIIKQHPLKNDPSINTSRQTFISKNDISYYSKMDQPSVRYEVKKKENPEEKIVKKRKDNCKFSQDKKIQNAKDKNFLSPRYLKSDQKPKIEKNVMEREPKNKKTNNIIDLMKMMNIKYKNEELKEHKKSLMNFRKMTADKKSPSNDNFQERYKTETKKQTEEIKNTRNILNEIDKLEKEEKEYLNTDYKNDYRSTEYKITEKISLNDILKDNENNEINQTQDTIQKVNETDGQTIDLSAYESMKTSLENLFGKEAFEKCYSIVKELVRFNDKKISPDSSYNHEEISKALILNLRNSIEGSLLLLSIDKIPDLYILVIKERELQMNKF